LAHIFFAFTPASLATAMDQPTEPSAEPAAPSEAEPLSSEPPSEPLHVPAVGRLPSLDLLPTGAVLSDGQPSEPDALLSSLDGHLERLGDVLDERAEQLEAAAQRMEQLALENRRESARSAALLERSTFGGSILYTLGRARDSLNDAVADAVSQAVYASPEPVQAFAREMDRATEPVQELLGMQGGRSSFRNGRTAVYADDIHGRQSSAADGSNFETFGQAPLAIQLLPGRLDN